MALYFVTRKNVDLNTLSAGTKIIWNEGASAEFEAWRNSVDAQTIQLALPFAEVPAALVTGVMDVYATSSLASATTAAANVAGGSLFNENGTLISLTPSPNDTPDNNGPGDHPSGDHGGVQEDFVLIIRKELGIHDANALSGAAIGTFDNAVAISLKAHFNANNIAFEHLVFQNIVEVAQAYQAGRIDVVAWPSSADAARLLRLLTDPAAHTILTLDDDAQPVPDYVITIALLYEAGLAREADAPGLNYWIDQHEAGMGFDAMAGLFLDSAEFTSRFGDDDAMGNAEFVNVMYLNVLERPGEQAGLDYWVGAMDGGLSREAVLVGFARSPENMQASSVNTLHEVQAGYWDFA